MIILLRGHIRNSFDNQKLYNLLKTLSILFPIDIYIHTWHIVQSNVSWRKLEVNPTKVTNDFIYAYLKDLSQFVRHIIIDNDTQIKHIGYTEGEIIQVPVIGWKNMWYGKFRIAEYCMKNVNNDTHLQGDPLVINMRFDVLCNSNYFAFNKIVFFIQKIDKYKQTTANNLNRNIFMKNIPTCYGIDNIYFGSIQTMYILSYHFHHHLDHILNIYKYNDKIKAQEGLVPLENRRIFSNDKSVNIQGFFHPKYRRKYVPSIYGKNTGVGVKYRPHLKLKPFPKPNLTYMQNKQKMQKKRVLEQIKQQLKI